MGLGKEDGGGALICLLLKFVSHCVASHANFFDKQTERKTEKVPSSTTQERVFERKERKSGREAECVYN